MARYYLAPCLSTLRIEINIVHPERDKTSDGWIGDTSHAARKSDHNPDYPNDGVVRATDTDKDGIDCARLLELATNDYRTEYVIWNGFIYSRAYGFKKRVYTGPNKHYGHLHISIRHGKTYENDTRSWGYVDTPTPAPNTPTEDLLEEPVMKINAAGPAVAFFQECLKAEALSITPPRPWGKDITVDGQFGEHTQQAVDQYQRGKGLPANGEIDWVTGTLLARHAPDWA